MSDFKSFDVIAYVGSVVVFFLGVLNTVGIFILKGLKENDKELFTKVNKALYEISGIKRDIENSKEDIRDITKECRERHRNS